MVLEPVGDDHDGLLLLRISLAPPIQVAIQQPVDLLIVLGTSLRTDDLASIVDLTLLE